MAKIDLPRRKSGVRGESTIPPNLDKALPPSTPPQKPRKLQGKGSLSAPRTRLSNNLRDTFIADRARGTGGGNEHHRKQSSHDLSWTPRQTRDSVMDNMLQSLDQMYAVDYPPRTAPPKSTEPHDPFGLGPYSPNRPRGHTFSSSLSSDRSLRLQDTPPGPSRSTRGHRSNSSSNFSSGLTRIDSVRADSKRQESKGRAEKEESASIREKLYDSQRALGPEEKAAGAASRSRSRKMSKSSASSSLDFGQMIQEGPGKRSIQRRSSSFDLAEHRRRDAELAAGRLVRAHLPSKRNQVPEYHELDAAPTPVIPSGPSRNNSPVRSNFPASYSATTEPRTLPVRDKASKNATALRHRNGEKGEERSRKAKSNSRWVPSHSKSPSMDAAIPATPTIAEKARNASESTTVTPVNGQAKERPGFFRRVFGSSRSTITTMTDSGVPEDEASRPASNTRGSSRGITISQFTAPSTAPSKLSMTVTTTESPGPTTDSKETKDLPAIPLNKKSSFFRRRKKSVSGEPPMPTLLPQLEPPNFQEPYGRDPHPSPVSSLRKVMDPYLSHALSAHPTRKGDVRENEVSRGIPIFPQPDFVFAPRVDSLKKLVTVPNLPVENAGSENVAVDVEGDVAEPVPTKGESLNATTPVHPTDTTTPPKRDHAPSIDKNLENQGHVHHNPNHHESRENCANDQALIAHSDDMRVALDISSRPHRSRSATTSTIPAATSGRPPSSELLTISRSESYGHPGDMMNTVRQEKGVLLTDWDSPVSVHSPLTRDVSLSKTSSSGRSARIYLQPTASEDDLLNSKPTRASLKLTKKADMGNCLGRPDGCECPDCEIMNFAEEALTTGENVVEIPRPGGDIFELGGTEVHPTEASATGTLAKKDDTIEESANDMSAIKGPAMALSTTEEAAVMQIVHYLDTLTKPISEPKVTFTEDQIKPSGDDYAFARRIFEGDATAVPPNKAAAWLVGDGIDRANVREAYMKLFDWKDMSILAALRNFCSQLYIRGETTVLDSIFKVFSARWCECNPNHGFKSIDVVHLLAFSIVLVNTDLHVLPGHTKMTKTEFIEQTKDSCIIELEKIGEDVKDSVLSPVSSDHALAQSRSDSLQIESSNGFAQPKAKRSIYRSSIMPSDQDIMLPIVSSTENGAKEDARSPIKAALDQDVISPVAATGDRSHKEDPGPLVRAPYVGSISGWAVQLEKVLKNIYESIRKQALPLHGDVNSQVNTGTLSSKAGNMLRRTPSLLSKANSENQVPRTRQGENAQRFGATRWNAKTRPRPRLANAVSVSGPSGRSSLDNDSSAIPSPSGNSTWTKHSVNRTANSISVESFATTQTEAKTSIGFTGVLSQAIIREESLTNAGASTNGTVINDNSREIPLLEDESLQLVGAPWAKEGILKHKHHLEATDKRVRNRDWVECFAVVEKGWIRLFSFPSTPSRSLRQRFARNNRPAAGSVVGGGNWMDNAESVGNFKLHHTIAVALPEPGYSNSRPYVWALTTATGAVHMFDCGTAEIVNEFVSTANYWAARLSKEPLTGGVSNVEYGWSAAVIDPVYLLPAPATASSPSSPTIGGTMSSDGSMNSRNGSMSLAPGNNARPSMQGSVRGSHDHNIAPVRIRLPGDRAVIADWLPPAASMMGSRLLEVDQLRTIKTYLLSVRMDLRQHLRVKEGMEKAFTPRHPNEAKAMKNWARKNEHLRNERIKFATYVESLTAAQAAKTTVEAERAARASQADAI